MNWEIDAGIVTMLESEFHDLDSRFVGICMGCGAERGGEMKIILEVDGEIGGTATEADKEAIALVIIDRIGGIVLSEEIDETDRFAFFFSVSSSMDDDGFPQDRCP